MTAIMRGTSLALSLVLVAFLSPSISAAVSPPRGEDAIACAKAVPSGPGFERVQCYFADRAPFVPSGMSVGSNPDTQNPGLYPMTYQMPAPRPLGQALKLELFLHDEGAGAAGYSACEGEREIAPDYLQIRNCAGGYPAPRSYAVGSVSPAGWWGPYGGHVGPAAATNADGARLAEAVTYVKKLLNDSIDSKAGIKLTGEGSGGTGAILQSLVLPNPWWQKSLTVVEAHMPHTLFVEEVLPKDAAAQLAWGDTDTQQLNFRKAAAAGLVDHIYYRINGSSADADGRVNPDFFRICEQYRIACFGTWHAGGHTRSEKGVNLPVALFTDAFQDVRLSQLLPVFTRSTANHWGQRGHYNLGLSWNSGGIVREKNRIVVPLRYQRFTNLTESPATRPLPDQPQQATFTLTLRRAGPLAKNPGRQLNWEIRGTQQAGTAVVAADGSITIEGITLVSGNGYSPLWVTPAAPAWSLVYTRQPRANKPIPGTPVEEAANWQHASDVGRINQGMAEADVVIDDLHGNVKVIYNCTRSQEICVAQEARVSPDGTKIVYSVGKGNTLFPLEVAGVKLGIYDIPGLTEARLWIYDLKTGKNTPVPNHPAQAIDRQPEWLSNTKIVFASNRANTYPIRNQFGMHAGMDQFGNGRCFNYPYCVSQEYGYGFPGKSMQIWTINSDGTDPRNISPHESNALAPAVMSNGDILYSCWNAQENKAFDAPTRHSNNPGTSKNKWWLCRTDGNGADATVILNGHKTSTIKTREWLPAGITGGEGRSELRALRSVAEIFKGKIAVSNYYRSNHVGSMGIVYGLDYVDPHVEGCSTASCYPDGESRSGKAGSGQYVPSSLRALTPYGTDQDIEVRLDSQRRPLGKAGYAAPLPNTNSEYLITHARGLCYEEARPELANRAAMRGEPTCQKAIYKVKVPMVTNPFDKRQMEFMAGGEQWQAYDARAIATFQSLHGQPQPKQLPPLNPQEGCYLQVVDARKAELHPRADRYNWATNLFEQCAFQGCAVNTEDPDFYSRTVANLTVLLPQMWDFTYGGGRQEEFANAVNNMGHKSIGLLGSQPLLADGSVKMRVPCETPILMAGTDKDGMAIAHDAMLHSLRAGETRTCHGCHDGHSEERAAQIGAPATERIKKTLAYASQPAMPGKKAPVTFADVQPILEQRCSGCHKDMTNADGLLYSRVAQDYDQFDWAWAKKQPGHGQHDSIKHVLVQNPGRGYRVGEPLQFQGGGARGTIAAVGPGGDIREIRLLAGGDAYNALTPVTVKSAGGSGAHLAAMTGRFELARPYTSKWVAKFARDSLLYWKCIGSRQDGRSDKQYNNDIDFGTAHASGATPSECHTIGRWIDMGIQR